MTASYHITTFPHHLCALHPMTAGTCLLPLVLLSCQ
jgi:hypothetical protein